jgi:hypothetical protein
VNAKIPVVLVSPILILSLATWWFFYAMSLPLDSGATLAVVGMWTGIAIFARWIWKQPRKTGSKKKGRVKRVPLNAILFAALLSPPLAEPAQRTAETSPVVACSADTPAVAENGVVSVRVWMLAAGRLEYTWNATAGSISGTESEARWDLAEVAPGIYRATVKVRGPDIEESCSVRLLVTDSDRGTKPPVETGRGFLENGQKETPGYGLYSYLLIGAPPIESTRDRYLKVINAYLNLLPAIEQLKRNIRIQEINATYLPVDRKAPNNVSAEWLLEHYDYSRARALLRLVPGNLREGPYFVSSLTPLTGATEMPERYLFQNLSAVPTAPSDLASWWVRQFMNQAAQERFWNSKSVAEVALKLRTTLAILSVGLPDVQQSLKDWISWTH